MKNILKKIYFLLPKFIRRFFLQVYEDFYAHQAAKKLGIKIKTTPTKYNHDKPRILFYQLGGMGHGGTSKHTQNIAKYLNKEKYDVYYMFSRQSVGIVGGTGNSVDDRMKNLMDLNITWIEYVYNGVDKKHPHILKNMKPSFYEVLKNNEIDLIIVNTDGKSYFPFNIVRDIPIILLNVFGSYTVQKNIVLNACHTPGMVKRICRVVDKKVADWLYHPCESPTYGSENAGKELRRNLGIKEKDVVFGRIGRDVDTIFHPIGIRAFQKVVKEYPQAHYLIMSPPPILRKIVEESHIPNIHFLAPSSDEEKIWAFHQALDAYAHFRNDGETFGMNIAEAMLCAKPIITHRSFVWNEHLSYLDESFSRVAGLNNVSEYARFLKEFINRKKDNSLIEMGKKAKEKAVNSFGPKIVVERFEKFIERALNTKF